MRTSGEGGAELSGNKRDRDRATEAFRRWARAGCPGMDEIRRHGGASAGELLACAAVFDALERDTGRRNRPGPEIVEAVRAVYMRDPGRPLRRSEVTMRARRFAVGHYVSERTVYYWLTIARTMWQEIADGCNG